MTANTWLLSAIRYACLLSHAMAGMSVSMEMIPRVWVEVMALYPNHAVPAE